MNDREVGRYWDENAKAWTTLTRMGCDMLRDHVNTPAFLAMLPDVSGLRGLDVGCGEGHNTRMIADHGARMTAVDVSFALVTAARDMEDGEPRGIWYQEASALALPFGDQSFDFVVATMSLMDMPDHPRAVAEVFRVLKRGGFFQFSISHPCFATPRWQWLHNERGQRDAVVCGDYFRELDGDIETWMFTATPDAVRAEFPEFRIPRFTRTLSRWLNLLLESGFVLERFDEPHADEETARQYPTVADSRAIAYALIVRCRRPQLVVEEPL